MAHGKRFLIDAIAEDAASGEGRLVLLASEPLAMGSSSFQRLIARLNDYALYISTGQAEADSPGLRGKAFGIDLYLSDAPDQEIEAQLAHLRDALWKSHSIRLSVFRA